MKRRHLSAAIILIATSTASAITIDDAVNILSAGRHSIQSETLSARADIELMKAEASLPGPEIEFTHQWGERKSYGKKLDGGISQSFDWPGVYAARRKAVRDASDALTRLEAARVNELAGQIRELLVEYIGARRTIAAIRETDAVLSGLDSLTRRAYARGEISILDVNKLAIARADISHSLHVAAGRIKDLEASISETSETDSREILKQLNDTYPDLSIPDESTYMSWIAENDPEYLANTADRRAAELSAAVERRSLYPGFSVGYVYTHEVGESFHGFSLGMTLPSASARHRAKAARLQAEATSFASVGQDASRRAQYNALVSNATELNDEIKRLGPVFDKFDNIRLLEKAYLGGQISMLDFLKELDYFYQARMNYIDDQMQYHLVLSKLNRYNF